MRSVLVAVGIAFVPASAASAHEVAGDVDCAGLGTLEAADHFLSETRPGDPHRLDADGDGEPCESKPRAALYSAIGAGVGVLFAVWMLAEKQDREFHLPAAFAIAVFVGLWCGLLPMVLVKLLPLSTTPWVYAGIGAAVGGVGFYMVGGSVVEGFRRRATDSRAG